MGFTQSKDPIVSQIKYSCLKVLIFFRSVPYTNMMFYTTEDQIMKASISLRDTLATECLEHLHGRHFPQLKEY